MTITLTGAPRDAASTTRRYFPSYTGPAAYATGGDTGMLAALGVGKIFCINALIITNGTVVLVGVYLPATDAIQWFVASTGAEVANGVDLSGYTGQFEVCAQ